jgi:hypothetical protein
VQTVHVPARPLATYVVDDETYAMPVAQAARVCAAILDVLSPRLRWAVIDAFTDHDDADLSLEAATRMPVQARSQSGSWTWTTSSGKPLAPHGVR